MYKLADDAHYGIIFDTCVDNNYKFLITCSDDRSINIYDYKTGDLYKKLAVAMYLEEFGNEVCI